MGPSVQTALVTGGSQGIGAAISSRLARDGWQVIAVSRKPVKGGDGIRREALDVADPNAVSALFGSLKAQGIRLDGLVNNAGIQGGQPIEEQTLEEWQRFLDVNVTGAWAVTRAALPLLSDAAAVVNVGSVASVQGFAGRAAYCASKHALLGLTRALAVELAPRGIRVNHLVLGSFDTPGLGALAAAGGLGADAYSERQLLGRLGNAGEAAAACAFLMSEDAHFVTGTSLTVDGGFLLNAAPVGMGRKSCNT